MPPTAARGRASRPLRPSSYILPANFLAKGRLFSFCMSYCTRGVSTESMTTLAGSDTAGDLAAYRAREKVLYQVRESLEASQRWDDFVARLAAQGLPEARVRQIVDVPVPMDLHLHSTHSDGQIPAQKLAWLARVIGLKTIALADHDNISGTRALYGEATLLGLSAIPAVELSTDQPGMEILVYFPDAGRFFDFLTTPRGSRFQQYLLKSSSSPCRNSMRGSAGRNRTSPARSRCLA